MFSKLDKLRQKLIKWIHDPDLSYKFILFFLGLRIFTDYSVIEGFVGCVNESTIYKLLISRDFKIEYNAVFAFFATLYLPPLIAVYSLSKNTSLLYKLYIKETFSIKIIIGFVCLVLISQKSISLLYFVFVFFYIFIHFKKIYDQFIDFFISKKTEIFFNFLKKIIKSQSTERIKYLDVIKKIDNWKNDELKDLNKIKDDDESSLFWIGSFSRPEKVDTKKLSEWFSKVKESIESKEKSEPRGDLVTSNIEGSQPPFDLEVVRDDDRLSVSFYIKIDVNYEINKDDLDSHNRDFKNYFEECKPLDEDKKKFSEYIENIDLHLLSLLEKKDFDKFNEEINLIKGVTDELKKDKKSLKDLITLTFKILNVVESTKAFNEYNFLKNSLLEFWVSLFECFMHVENSRYMDYLFKILVKAFEKKIFTEKDQKSLERDLTSIIKNSTATKDFFIDYSKALVETARNFSDEEAEIFEFFIRMINNLQDDVDRGYLAEDDETTAKIILQYSRQACMFLGAVTLYDDKKKLFKTASKYIEEESFFSTLEELYLNNEREWPVLSWMERGFDRHGHGPTKSFSPTTVYTSFIVEFFKTTEDLTSINKATPNYRLKHLFSEALRLFNEAEHDSEAYKTIDGIIKEHYEIENSKIIKCEISDQKVDEFITTCFEEYKRRVSLSKLLEFKKQETDEDDGLGYNTTMPKEWFLDDFPIKVSGHSSYGRGLAVGEDNKIYSEIKEYITPKKSELNKLFTQTIQEWVKKGRTHFIVTNHHNWGYRIFNWENQCKENKNLSRKFDAEKKEKFVFADNKEEIDVYRLRGGKSKEGYFYMLIAKDNNISGSLRVLEEDNSDGFKTKESLVYRVRDLSEHSKLRDKISADKEYFKDLKVPENERDHFLSLKVIVELYVSPKLNKIADKHKHEIEIFEITDADRDK